jgi:hypothetical protein
MGASKEQAQPPAAIAAESQAQTPVPAAPVARIWEDQVGTGDPIAFDPEMHEPPLSPEEIKEILKQKG